MGRVSGWRQSVPKPQKRSPPLDCIKIPETITTTIQHQNHRNDHQHYPVPESQKRPSVLSVIRTTETITTTILYLNHRNDHQYYPLSKSQKRSPALSVPKPQKRSPPLSDTKTTETPTSVGMKQKRSGATGNPGSTALLSVVSTIFRIQP